MDAVSAPNFGRRTNGINVGVVDWVLVEVRAAAADTAASEFDGDTVTVQIPALLLSNGVVVDAVKFFGDLDDAAERRVRLLVTHATPQTLKCQPQRSPLTTTFA